MTDRHAGYLVTLAADIREDDAEATLIALRMVKGVLSVEPVVSTTDLHIAHARADYEWRSKLVEMARVGPTVAENAGR